jgi:hypothetical protein
MTRRRRGVHAQASLNNSAPKELLVPTLDSARVTASTSMVSEQAIPMVSGLSEPRCLTESRTGPRRWHRYKIDVPIRVIVHAGGTTRVFDGRGSELSDGGMALTAWTELRPGSEVDIEFTPPYSSSPIRITGKICNRTGYRYGVEFLARSDQETQRADRLLAMLTNM